MQNSKKSTDTLTQKDTKFVALWKTCEYIGLVLFFILLPRSLGPERYGDFALVMSILGLLILSNGLGSISTFGRFLPQFKLANQTLLIKGLFTQYFILRIAISGSIILIFLVGLSVINSEMRTEVFPTKVILAICGAYLFGVISLSCTHLFYGLNKMGLYLFSAGLNRLLIVILLLVYWQDIALENTIYSIAIVEALLALIALYFAREYFSISAARAQLSSFMKYFKFGIALFVSNILLMIIWRSGEMIISFMTYESEQIAFYQLSNAMFLTLKALFAQVATILLPSINLLHTSGDITGRNKWIGDMFTYLSVTTVIALIAINSVAEPLFALLLGDGFSDVTTNLRIISLSILPLNIARLSLVFATINDKPKEHFKVSLAALLTFVITSLLLTKSMGSIGVSVSVVVSSTVAAGFAFYYFNLSEVVKIKEFILMVALCAIFIGFILISDWPKVLTGIVSILVFIIIIVLLRIIDMSKVIGLFTDTQYFKR